MTTAKKRIDLQIDGMAKAASIDWYRRQCRNVYAHMYFYFKPGEIAFYIGEEPLNNAWELASPERVSIGKSQREVQADIRRIARNLPILS
tara:strand:+ start:435 stop:704 length:270 start_codon:yes stop_codon:yes gene_type:complete